jgi:hypothetical protein
MQLESATWQPKLPWFPEPCACCTARTMPVSGATHCCEAQLTRCGVLDVTDFCRARSEHLALQLCDGNPKSLGRSPTSSHASLSLGSGFQLVLARRRHVRMGHPGEPAAGGGGSGVAALAACQVAQPATRPPMSGGPCCTAGAGRTSCCHHKLEQSHQVRTATGELAGTRHRSPVPTQQT